MFKCQISALKYGKRLAILILIAALLLGTFACTGPGPLQTGVIEDEEELLIDGEIMFTISNESGTASEAAAPNAIANAFMRKTQRLLFFLRVIPRGIPRADAV